MNLPEMIVLARWNLNLGKGKNPFVNKALANPHWHDHRLEMWKRYCLPSILRQNHETFRMWLLCDPTKPKENQQLRETLPDERFEIVDDWQGKIGQFCAAGKPDDAICICRIDSDDMYHHGLLAIFARSWQQARTAGKNYIQAALGYALDVATGNLYRWDNPSPPFFCAPVLRKQVASMPGGRHVCHHGRVFQQALSLKAEPLFCVTLHEVNIHNSTRASWLKEKLEGQILAMAQKEYSLI